MNYFAHAHRFLARGNGAADPYFLAGTAVPDWLSVVDRRTRCRPRHAEAWIDDADARAAALARGVLQHHEDDRQFHATQCFVELSLSLSRTIHRSLDEVDDLRPGFLGHILVELLLDAELIAADPGLLDGYYTAIASVDGPLIADCIERMTERPVPRLPEFIGRFVEVAFLRDYGDDERLCYRVSQVLQRVGLAPLPGEFVGVVPQLRAEVRGCCSDLLAFAEVTEGDAQ